MNPVEQTQKEIKQKKLLPLDGDTSFFFAVKCPFRLEVKTCHYFSF